MTKGLPLKQSHVWCVDPERKGMLMEQPPRSKDLKPGMYVAHESGTVHQLQKRKPDGTGWWLTDRGGLDDRVIDEYPDWLPIGPWLFAEAASLSGS